MRAPTIAVAAATSFVSVPAAAMWGGSGVVVELTSGQAVPGATVTLDCRTNLLHGSRSLKTLSALTDDKGRFSFSFFDVWRCDFAYVNPSKAGYIDTGRLDIRYIPAGSGTEIPAKLYLTV